MNNINIPKQSIPDIENETVKPNTNKDSFRRYIVKKYDGSFFEVNKKTYDRVKNNPFFEVSIINWYIKGTEEFVKKQNKKELQRAEKQLQGISRIVINPLQFYQYDNRK